MYMPILELTIVKKPKPSEPVYFVSNIAGAELEHGELAETLMSWTKDPEIRDQLHHNEDCQRQMLADFIYKSESELKLTIIRHNRWDVIVYIVAAQVVSPQAAESIRVGSEWLADLIRPMTGIRSTNYLNLLHGPKSLLRDYTTLIQNGIAAVYYKVQEFDVSNGEDQSFKAPMFVTNVYAANIHANYKAILRSTEQYLLLNEDTCPDDTTAYKLLAQALRAVGCREEYTIFYANLDLLNKLFDREHPVIKHANVIGHTFFMSYVDQDGIRYSFEAPLRQCMVIDLKNGTEGLMSSLMKLIKYAQSERFTRNFLKTYDPALGEPVPVGMWAEHYLAELEGKRLDHTTSLFPVRNKHKRWLKHLGLIPVKTDILNQMV